MRPARVVASALACLALAVTGCGGDDESGGDAGEGRPAEGGTLRYALAAEPMRLDPLLAADRASQVVTRQIHEPLVDTVSAPFGEAREEPGLTQASSSSSDATIWRFRLRPRVRFGDGTPLNASAVLANADRWLASSAAAALVPSLAAVDAPRPDLVRFILDRPDREFPDRLEQARLGLVSPRALAAGKDLESLITDGGTGTGAFEFRERESAGNTVLARNLDWWGSRVDLGPALDQLDFSVAPEVEERVVSLAGGQVEVADSLDARAAREVRSDPLLTVEGGAAGPPIGIERSVRGVEFAEGVPVLSGAWLTTVGAGE